MIYYILAFLAGAFTLISMITNSNLSHHVGAAQSALVNFLAGLTVSIIGFFILNSKPIISGIGLPKWAFFGGFLGVFIVIISNIVIPKIPTVYTTLLIFIGQLLTGILLDFFQTMTISPLKIIGAVIITIGLYYNFLVDKQEKKKEQLLDKTTQLSS